MKETVNDRILKLMQAEGVDEADVAQRIGKDKSTMYRITNKETVPSKTTVKLIADAFGVDFSELQTGKKQQNAIAKMGDTPWKDEAYTRLKSDMDYLKEQYAKVLDALINGKGGKQLALKIAEMFKQAA